MAVTISQVREHEFYGLDQDNKKCLFPRSMQNREFALAFNARTKNILFNDDYNAFPYAIEIGSSIVGIFSTGDSHASSAKQVMWRTDDDYATISTVDFYVAATGVFDFSLLTDLIPSGSAEVFKVWTVKNTGGTFAATAVPTVSYGGLSYAMWSKVVAGPGGKFFRTGYAANGSDIQAALFESTDKLTWAGKIVLFSGAGLKFSEVDIVNTSGSNWLAVCREDTGDDNPLYYATSTDDCATFSAAADYDTASINGRQPNLIKLASGSIILCAGDRSGASGYGSSGDVVTGNDNTGVCLWRSDDAGSTWNYRTRLSPIYSTDGGQPYACEIDADRVSVVFYARTRIDKNPGIATVAIDVASL